MVQDFRNFTSCDCILLPVFYHCVGPHRFNYESMSVELFPLYCCSCHRLPEKPAVTGGNLSRNSPRKLVKFRPDGSYFPLQAPSKRSSELSSSLSTDTASGGPPTVKKERIEVVEPLEVVQTPPSGVIFKNSSLVLPSTSNMNSVQFRNSN